MRPLAFVLLALAVTAGCGPKTPDTVLAPPAQYDPDGMAAAALKLYDKNKDGRIDGSEFAACPPLKRLKNGKAVTREDLKARFEAYAAAGPDSVAPATIQVNQDTSPYPLVVCTLTPEPFMGPGFKPATCTTDESGFGEFKVEGAAGAGVPAGFYKLTVSQKNADGREGIPAAFNARSQDVRELFNDGRNADSAMQVDVPAQ